MKFWPPGYDIRAFVIFLILFAAVRAFGPTVRPIDFLVGFSFALVAALGGRSVIAGTLAYAAVFAIDTREALGFQWRPVQTAVAHGLAFLIPVALLRYANRGFPWFSSVRSTVNFVVAAVATSAMEAALEWLIVGPLPGSGANSPGTVRSIQGWHRSASGILVISPVILIYAGGWLNHWVARRPADGIVDHKLAGILRTLPEILGCILGGVLMLWLAVWMRGEHRVDILFLAFAPLGVAAARHGVRVTSVVLAASMLVAGALWLRMQWQPLVPIADLRIAAIATSISCLLIASALDQRRRAQRELEARAAELRSLARNIEHAREQEKTRIAREVHDELGQALTGLKMSLSLLSRRAAAGMEQRELAAGVRGAIGEVDSVIGLVDGIESTLRPAILDSLGIASALEWLASDFQKKYAISCRFTRLDRFQLDRERATAVFRVLQEALTNIARHAEASQVAISLAVEPHGIELVVEDDGKGYSPSHSGLGILGMRERAALLGGTLAVRNRSTKGARVHLFLPLSRNGLS